MTKAAMILLTYSKAFYTLGAQARGNKTNIGNMQTILHLHDAMEFCLRAVLEEYGIVDNSQDYKGIVKSINNHFGRETLPRKLPYQGPMEFLGTTRGKVKHHASIPSREDTERCERSTYSFLERVCDEFFSLNFDTLSQVDLVENPDVQGLLKLSERQADDSDIMGAVLSIKKAWLIAQPSISTFIDKTDYQPGIGLWAVPELSLVHDTTKALQERIGTIERTLASVMMGVDPLRLQRFEETTPEVISHTNGIEMYPNAIPPSSDAVREARDFVVEMILKW